MSTVGKKEGIDHSVSPKRDTLVVPPGARGAESMHPAHVHEPESSEDESILNISKLIIRKKAAKMLKKKQERRALAGKAKNPSSSSSSVSSVSSISLSPNEILEFEEEEKKGKQAKGSPKSLSPRLRLSPLARGVGAQARRKKSSSSSSSSSSKSPKGRKPLTPRFEKIKARSVSPKRKGKEGKEHSGGGTRKKQKRKLRKTHSRKRR
jgi:hypothetical protein